MGHPSSIIDSDTHYVINALTRKIINEDSSQKVVITQGDHNSERFTFEVSRYIEGHDMSECNIVQVHYVNNRAMGVYEVDDFQVSTTLNNICTFSWLISNNATQNVAILSFAVIFKCTSGDELLYQWGTIPYEKVSIVETNDNGDVVVEEYADILNSWYQKLIQNGLDCDEVLAKASASANAAANSATKSANSANEAKASANEAKELVSSVDGDKIKNTISHLLCVDNVNTDLTTKSIKDLTELTDTYYSNDYVITAHADNLKTLYKVKTTTIRDKFKQLAYNEATQIYRADVSADGHKFLVYDDDNNSPTIQKISARSVFSWMLHTIQESTLSTTAKTLAGAINELYNSITTINTGFATTESNMSWRSAYTVEREFLIKYGNVVQLTFLIRGTFTSTYTTVGTLPKGYRPKTRVDTPIDCDHRTKGTLYVGTAGNIQIACAPIDDDSSTSGFANGTITFIAG